MAKMANNSEMQNRNSYTESLASASTGELLIFEMRVSTI